MTDTDLHREAAALNAWRRDFSKAMARFHRAAASMLEMGDHQTEEEHNAICDEVFEAREDLYRTPAVTTRDLQAKLSVYRDQERDNDVNETAFDFLKLVEGDLERIERLTLVQSLIDQQRVAARKAA